MTVDADRTWTDEVADYYDRNSGRFLLVGNGRRAHSMHRELWGPGVRSARDAAAHVDDLVADEIGDRVSRPDPVVVDFGCGVGGTLFHLAERFPGARLSGITVSRRQRTVAERLIRRNGLQGRCSVALGDFQTADLDVRADAVIAIESFVHSESAGAFLGNAAAHLGSGGHLVVVDDFLASEPEALSPRQLGVVDRFRAGWRVPSVCTVDTFVRVGEGHGLEPVKILDLTSLTRPGSRARDRLVGALSPLLARLGLVRVPFYANMIGGDALQTGLREGFLRYRLLVLRRVA